LVHFLTFSELPSRDGLGRPRFAYGEEIHEDCERRRHYKNDRFVREWGDEGHRKGWCLKKMGCRGPETHHNCPIVRWNQESGWPVAAGHGCIGCAEPRFWDRHSPFYVETDDDDD
jgi:hydrogenase small subunit